MPCAREWGPLLSKYVDQEVSPDERRVVENHVLECKTCVSTLELFRRHDKLLDSALAGEAFGDLVVDDVMAEIRRVEMPAVVAPEAGTSAWKSTMRRWWPAATAAALLVVAGAALVVMMGVVKTLREEVHTQSAKLSDLELERLENERRNARLGDRDMLVYFTPGRTMLVKSMFEGTFDSFELHRSDDNGTTWERIVTGLREPLYEDTRVSEDRRYLYKFIAVRGSTRVESAHMQGEVPEGSLSPKSTMNVLFIGCTNDMKRATFKITRFVDGEERDAHFVVGLHERVGDWKDGVNYSTELTLSGISLGDEQLGAGVDDAGEHYVHITRQNKMAHFRAVDPPSSTRSVWRGSAICVPLPR